ncbi:MAG: flagellin [bacterium]|nr:flagellin [bacterium]
MIIQHNMAAANTNRQLGVASTNLSKSTEKLSSGYRINRAADDAAGLSISEKMRGQIRGLDQASSNAQDGISMVQTAEGALAQTEDILQRMRELTVQGANDTYVDEDRKAIAEELKALRDEVNRISSDTEFNKKKLLDGSLTDVQLQVGGNSDQRISFSVGNMSASGAVLVLDTVLGTLGIPAGDSADAMPDAVPPTGDDGAPQEGNYGTSDDWSTALDGLDAAISQVSTQRSQLGAVQNRLEYTIANADNTSENLQSAESRIRDVDMADEMVKYSKNSILQQASQSMLAQAKNSTQGVLSLLQ